MIISDEESDAYYMFKQVIDLVRDIVDYQKSRMGGAQLSPVRREQTITIEESDKNDGRETRK